MLNNCNLDAVILHCEDMLLVSCVNVDGDVSNDMFTSTQGIKMLKSDLKIYQCQQNTYIRQFNRICCKAFTVRWQSIRRLPVTRTTK